jgi:hypothetical protein
MTVYAVYTVGSELISNKYPLIFLAGPIERVHDNIPRKYPRWRNDAVKYFSDNDPIVSILSPEWGVKPQGWSYEGQVLWEVNYMEISDVILCWIPRQLPDLPGFTTNIEVGEHFWDPRLILGAPQEAPNMRYLQTRCCMAKKKWETSLEGCCLSSLSYIKDKYLYV